MLANVASLLLDAHTFCRNLLHSRTALAAENLFLRKQLTFYQERQKRPHRTNNATRFTMVLLARLFEWEQALVVVKTATFTRWHRRGFRLFWRWKSRAQGRPVIPEELQELIRRMSRDNVSWGEERIANELFVKLGLHVSPRTVRKYMPPRDNRGPHRFQSSPTWATFVRNHAQAIVAADFFTVITVRFHFLYVFVIMELGTRKILHLNVTEYPTAEWTLQQFRESIPYDHPYRFVILDRDSKFSDDLRKSVRGMGVRVLRTPPRAPQANCFCERLIGTIRRECLDFLIPLSDNHLRRILREWAAYFNRARPHSSLGPNVPDPSSNLPVEAARHPHRIPSGFRVVSQPILGGLHHDYRLASAA